MQYSSCSEFSIILCIHILFRTTKSFHKEWYSTFVEGFVETTICKFPLFFLWWLCDLYDNYSISFYFHIHWCFNKITIFLPNTLSSLTSLTQYHTPAGNAHTNICKSKKNDTHVVGWCSDTLAIIGMWILA